MANVMLDIVLVVRDVLLTYYTVVRQKGCWERIIHDLTD